MTSCRLLSNYSSMLRALTRLVSMSTKRSGCRLGNMSNHCLLSAYVICSYSAVCVIVAGQPTTGDNYDINSNIVEQLMSTVASLQAQLAELRAEVAEVKQEAEQNSASPDNREYC